MNLEDFLDHDEEIDVKDDELFAPLSVKAWQKQTERVLAAYQRECEMYRREVRAMQDQFNEMARLVSDLRADVKGR